MQTEQQNQKPLQKTTHTTQTHEQNNKITTTKSNKSITPKVKQRVLATCIKLTSNEHKELKQLSIDTGKSIPQIYRDALNKRKPTTPLMNMQLAQKMISELNKIGANVNQIARKVNSGYSEGWYPIFTEFNKRHAHIYNLISNYGRGKS